MRSRAAAGRPRRVTGSTHRAATRWDRQIGFLTPREVEIRGLILEALALGPRTRMQIISLNPSVSKNQMRIEIRGMLLERKLIERGTLISKE